MIISHLLDWLDRDRWHFWLVALSVTLIWLTTLYRFNPRRPRLAATLWLLATFGLLLAWRWPHLVGPALLNPDEAQMIAGAITLKSHPLFWKYVDGTTHGPLADAPLLLANLFGVPLNYGGARLVAGLLVLGGFSLSGLGLSRIYPAPAVRLGLAPVMLLWASISFYDFTGYTSEQGAMFLVLAAVWPLLAGLTGPRPKGLLRWLLLMLGGFLLGCVPYAKLQATPIALALGAVALITAVARPNDDPRTRWHCVAALAIGALLPHLLVFVYLVAWGLLGQFWVSYVVSNIIYSQGGDFGWAEAITGSWAFCGAAPGLRAAMLSVLVSAVVAVALHVWPKRQPSARPWIARPPRKFLSRFAPHWRPLSRGTVARLAILATLSVAAVYATLAPRHLFGHYLQFLGLPLGLAGVVCCGELWPHLGRLRAGTRSGLLLILLLGTTVPPVIARARAADPDMAGAWSSFRGDIRHPTSCAIALLAHEGDTLSVWGWMPRFYVETGLPQATREAHTQRQIQWNPLIDFYRERYLRDFERRPPRIFVDAVGGRNFGFGESHHSLRHESFAAFAAVIARDYVLVAEVEGSRIYLRRS